MTVLSGLSRNLFIGTHVGMIAQLVSVKSYAVLLRRTARKEQAISLEKRFKIANTKETGLATLYWQINHSRFLPNKQS
jgi:hypothetical protein